MLISAVILGLLGSLHCLGMCGPIALMLPLKGSAGQKAAGLATYHLGRIVSYSLLGLAFGFVGKGLFLFGLQQKLSIGMGVLMIALVLLPNNWKKRVGINNAFSRILLRIKSSFGRLLGKPSPDALLSLGFLNGFLPCGLVYMALIGAVAMGDLWKGGIYMALFGLGTVPLMSLVVFGRQWIGTQSRLNLQRWVPVFVFFIGTLFILRGLGLGIPYVSPRTAPTVLQEQSLDCHQP